MNGILNLRVNHSTGTENNGYFPKEIRFQVFSFNYLFMCDVLVDITWPLIVRCDVKITIGSNVL